MHPDTFDQILRNRCQAMRKTLGVKAIEYATADCLHNFKKTAEEFGGTAAEACWGFMLKHLTSIRDMVKGDKPITPAMIEEKIGDAVNYLVLLEAIFLENIN